MASEPGFIIGTIFWGKHITVKNIYAVLISFIGVAFIASQGSIEGFAKTDALGAGLALFSSIIWAFYWIFNVKNPLDKLIMMFWNFMFGAIYLVLFGLIEFQQNIQIQFDYTFWSAIYVGVFELGLTYLIWMKALERSENNAVTGNFIFLAPFLSLIFYLFLYSKRKIYFTTLIGFMFYPLRNFYSTIKKEKRCCLKITNIGGYLFLQLFYCLLFHVLKMKKLLKSHL